MTYAHREIEVSPAAVSSAGTEKGVPPLLWLVIDGIPFWLVERFVARGEALPVLARLMREDRVRPLLPASPNCQTPPSLFSLFSATEPAEHGLTGFDIPDPEDPLAIRKAFASHRRDIGFIWDAYAREGRSVRLCQIPFVVPDALGDRLVSASYGFVEPALAPLVIERPSPGDDHALGATGARLAVEAVDPDVVHLRVTAEGRPVQVSGERWEVLALGKGLETFARLVGPEGKRRLVLLGAWPVLRTGTSSASDFPSAPFIAGGVPGLYRKGAFGRIAIDGGDGTAEAVLLDAVRALGRRFWAEIFAAQALGGADLILGYQPAYDLLFHEVLGLIDPASRFHEAGLAARIDADLLVIMSDIDGGLARLASAADGERIVVCSDHGMKPIDTVLLPNACLRDLGLLSLDAQGRIDPERSVAYFHPAETGLVCIHGENAKAAGLEPLEIMNRLVAALEAVAPNGCGWFAADAGLAVPSGYLGGHFLSAGEGKTFKADLGETAMRASRKSADHATHSGDPKLHGVVMDLSADPIPLPAGGIATHEVWPAICAREVAHAH